MENNAMVLHDPNVSLGLQKVADGLFKSGMFPNAKNAFGAYAIVQYGHELGIPPMMALKNINIISGQLACNAQLMLSMAMSRGVTYKVIAETDKGATIEFKRGDISYTATFNEEDAKAAGLTGKDNWKKYARDMYFWRAAAKGIRRIAPDAVLGLYTKDEISNGEIVDLSPKVSEAPQQEPIETIIDAQPEATPAPIKEVAPQANVASHDDDIQEAFVKIEEVISKEGTTNGKTWKAFFIKSATGGSYGTFSETLAGLANKHKEDGKLVRISHKKGKKAGSRELVSIEDDVA
jgi:hypothetical protein